MTRKIILVGQAPGARRGEPLDGGGGRRLSALAGLDHAEFLRRFERVNLLDEFPGKAGRGDQFDVRAARDRADVLRQGWVGRKVVLLGRGVAAALRLVPDDYEWFAPVEIPPGLEAAVMPHPSGISHWWNDPANVRRARDFMLSIKLGYFEFQRGVARSNHNGGQPEKFSPAQIAAALEAGRGVYTWAAEALAAATGISVTAQTITNYVRRYPDLATICEEQTARILNIAKHNIIRDIEAGGVDSSWKLLRSKVGQGSGYELVVHAKHEGQVVHTHDHSHRRVDDLTDAEAVEEWRRISKGGAPRPVN